MPIDHHRYSTLHLAEAVARTSRRPAASARRRARLARCRGTLFLYSLGSPTPSKCTRAQSSGCRPKISGIERMASQRAVCMAGRPERGSDRLFKPGCVEGRPTRTGQMVRSRASGVAYLQNGITRIDRMALRASQPCFPRMRRPWPNVMRSAREKKGRANPGGRASQSSAVLTSRF